MAKLNLPQSSGTAAPQITTPPSLTSLSFPTNPLGHFNNHNAYEANSSLSSHIAIKLHSHAQNQHINDRIARVARAESSGARACGGSQERQTA